MIVVHFEPWNFSNTDQLLSQFFIRLSSEFRSKGDERLTKIGEALETYSDAFDLLSAVPLAGGLLSFLGKKGAKAAGSKLKKGNDEKDISKQKEAVIKLLQEQPNRILVVIDDIDRLSNEQIRQVFQLVTSVAKFPNTIYLLLFLIIFVAGLTYGWRRSWSRTWDSPARFSTRWSIWRTLWGHP